MKNGNIIDWLVSGDNTIKYLTDKYLLGQQVDQDNTGYIQQYFDLFDENTNEWGGGIYSPLWISSHYTLLELKYMEATYNHPFYQRGANKLLDGLWFNRGKVSTRRFQDMCMSAMLLSIICYGRFRDERIHEIVDYILAHQMEDGGWNCAWDSTTNKSKRGSFHTTICVLEAFAEYEQCGYTYRLNEIKDEVKKGQEYLLSRKLLYSISKKKIADPDFAKFHYPTRYKYDCFRALEYFVDINYPYDERMNETLERVVAQLQNGAIRKGEKYSGKTHFKLETTKYSRFNTFRALKILKLYNPMVFCETTDTY
ncbi:hypothetical protein ACO1PF_05205 [Alkalibacterium sp. f15]|uniref:hypothetical protein n=1 Tax=Alkalibacterium sp. f15 TaxID=3414029 RepID=UPI003BF807F7